MVRNSLTFLFTDLENSTPLWEKFPDEMQRVFGWAYLAKNDLEKGKEHYDEVIQLLEKVDVPL